MKTPQDPEAAETVQTKETPEVAQERLVRLESALGLALHILGAQEPPDSRAVSDEFVAMASVLAGCENTAAIKIIAARMNIPREYITPEIVIISLPNVVITHAADGSENQSGRGSALGG